MSFPLDLREWVGGCVHKKRTVTKIYREAQRATEKELKNISDWFCPGKQIFLSFQ
jgi:hypothetical protein